MLTMNKMFYCLCFLLISLNVSHSYAGNPKYTVPAEYSFDTPEDYLKYEPLVIEDINWYLWSSLAFDQDKRQNASAFFIQWLTGTPNVTVGIDDKIVPFISTYPTLMMPFMMGWTKYSLEHNYSKDNIQNCIAGLRATIKYYDDNKFFFNKKEETLDKYKKMNDKKLAKYLSQFSSLTGLGKEDA